MLKDGSKFKCPRCGNLQLEPELAQSTNCRDAATTFTWRERSSNWRSLHFSSPHFIGHPEIEDCRPGRFDQLNKPCAAQDIQT